MTFAFDARRLRTTLRSAAIGLAAVLAAPLLAPAAVAAPARPGAVAPLASPIETVAARRVSRAKAVRARPVAGRRYGRRGVRNAAVIGAVATGVLGAIVAGQTYRDPYDDPGPAYVQYPYGYGDAPVYVHRPHRRYYQQSESYDPRYWRGGPPRQAAPGPGYYAPPRYNAPPQYNTQPPYYAPRQNDVRPRDYGAARGPGPGPGPRGPGPGPGPRGPAPGWVGGPQPGVSLPSTSYGDK